MNRPRAGLLLFALTTLAGVAVADQREDQEQQLVPSETSLSETILKTANRIDNFFSNERYHWTTNQTHLTLRLNSDFIEEHGWEYNPELKLNLALPGVNERLRFIVNEQDNAGAIDGEPSDQDESNAALRYVAMFGAGFGSAYDVGLSGRDGAFRGFFRVNLFRYYDLGPTWVGRTENRLYWYHDNNWRNDFRQSFERRLSDNWFFRTRLRIQYHQDKDRDFYPEQKFTLFQQINSRTAVAYEAVAERYFDGDAIFDDDQILRPDDRYTLFLLRLRFRQNVKWPWLFYEVWPTAVWTEERDYELTPAIRFRVEVILGSPPKLTSISG